MVVDTFVEAGFGRGSAELGIPTANIPPGLLAELEPGVYYGWARVVSTPPPAEEPAWVEESRQRNRQVEVNYGSELQPAEQQVLPMVMSIGWNPFYDNKQKSAEVHIMHEFKASFYGARIKVAVLGFIRNEQSYDSVDALIADIRTDIAVAHASLARPAYTEAKALVSN